MGSLKVVTIILTSLIISSCADKRVPTVTPSGIFDYYDWESKVDHSNDLLKKYTPVELTTDLSLLSENQKGMIKTLIGASQIMDDLFWYDAYGEKDELLKSVDDPSLKTFTIINYGPWDRLGGNASFIDSYGAKPPGANFYPVDMSKDEFEHWESESKSSLYTYIRRDADGKLISIPYHKYFENEVNRVSDLLLRAADFADNPQLKHYLTLRAAAIQTDDYQPSDMAWLDMKTNQIDIVIGPIETYEDQLYGYKASHTAYVLVKDMEWSKKLSKYAEFLPELQANLPVDEAYKKENPGSDTELNAYDVIYYAGDSNAGSKTIAINLPNDEEVQLSKGTRRLQLKNAMRAKFDEILVPIADMLINEDQRRHITFDAFFSNVMFHEVAHGLGIKNTINGNGTVRNALKEHASALEEGKADMLGLFMIKQLYDQGEIQGDLKDYYITFMASVFRSVRFGASSAHGKANMIRFNFFKEKGAFDKDVEKGTYIINFDKFEIAMNELAEMILTLQGDGDYDAVAQLVQEKARISPDLQSDLDRLADAGIPVDVVFKQGLEVMGL